MCLFESVDLGLCDATLLRETSVDRGEINGVSSHTFVEHLEEERMDVSGRVELRAHDVLPVARRDRPQVRHLHTKRKHVVCGFACVQTHQRNRRICIFDLLVKPTSLVSQSDHTKKIKVKIACS